MRTLPASEIKRRGIAAVDTVPGRGPVRIITRNRVSHIVLTEAQYEALLIVTASRVAEGEPEYRPAPVKPERPARRNRKIRATGKRAPNNPAADDLRAALREVLSGETHPLESLWESVAKRNGR